MHEVFYLLNIFGRKMVRIVLPGTCFKEQISAHVIILDLTTLTIKIDQIV
jgi:hypothetical protein